MVAATFLPRMRPPGPWEGGARHGLLGSGLPMTASAPQLGGLVCCRKYHLEPLSKHTDSGTLTMRSFDLIFISRESFTYVADREGGLKPSHPPTPLSCPLGGPKDPLALMRVRCLFSGSLLINLCCIFFPLNLVLPILCPSPQPPQIFLHWG